jgi:prevent-host-death family protein
VYAGRMADSAREMGISDARANMTEVIAEVRLLGRPVVLTRREKPQAVLVSVDFYERALLDRGAVKAVRQALENMPKEGQNRLAMDIVTRIINGVAKSD